MTSIGVARKVDHLGRIVLPVELRRLFGIAEGDHLAISVDGERIILEKVRDRCTFCGSTDDLRVYRSKPVCAECARELVGGRDVPTVG